MDLRDLLTTEEAAELKGWTPRYIARLIREDRLKAVKKAGRWFVLRPDLDHIAPADRPRGRPWPKKAGGKRSAG